MATIREVAPDIFRISCVIPAYNMQFNEYLIRDEQPALFHTGFRSTFTEVRDALATLIKPARLRWVGFSHFESDECGALNEWLALAPNAQAFCSVVAARVNLGDFAIREARGMTTGETLETGRHRLRFEQTPHVPHSWDAGLLFDETTRTLFSSDLFTMTGGDEALPAAEIVERANEHLAHGMEGPMAYSTPYTALTGATFERLGKLQPQQIAPMHAPVLEGDGSGALGQLWERIKGLWAARL